jgi:hypothetical protein
LYFIAITGVVPIALLTILFTHCLKRRKSKSGAMSFQCRTATKRCRCLTKRPRSYQQHLERQLQIAKFITRGPRKSIEIEGLE